MASIGRFYEGEGDLSNTPVTPTTPETLSRAYDPEDGVTMTPKTGSSSSAPVWRWSQVTLSVTLANCTRCCRRTLWPTTDLLPRLRVYTQRCNL